MDSALNRSELESKGKSDWAGTRCRIGVRGAVDSGCAPVGSGGVGGRVCAAATIVRCTLEPATAPGCQ